MNIDAVYKVFADLPDLVSPVPQVAHPNATMIGIIPLFQDPYFNEHNFPAFLKAAIYSRQSYLLHTDAIETDTAIKLYIETACQDISIPILEKNGLNSETDVLWFHAPPLPDTNNGVWGRLGKKMNLYWDPQLSAYEQVVYWDADMFKLDEPQFRDIFARIADTERVLSSIRVQTLPRRTWRPLIIRNSVKNVRFGGIPIQDIFRRAGLGRVLQEITGEIAKPLGGLAIYPAKRFHSQLHPFVNWLKENAPYIGDDEICLALGAAKFNIYLRCLNDEWHLTYAKIRDSLSGDEKHAFVHGKRSGDAASHYTQILKELTMQDSAGRD